MKSIQATKIQGELEQAPQDIQLAVDLIYLLEQNQIPIDIVLSALKIVERDFLSKQQNTSLS